MKLDNIEIKNYEGNDYEEMLQVFKANIENTKLLKSEIKKLKMIEESESKTTKKEVEPSKKTVVKQLNTEDKKNENINADFEDEIDYYMGEIRNIDEEDENEYFRRFDLSLPVRANPKFKKILLRIKAEIRKDILEIKEVLDNENDKEDIIYFRNEIIKESKKLNYIDIKLNAKEDEKHSEKPKKNKIYFTTTPNGNIRALEEISKIRPEFYERFDGLLESIKDSTFKNIKRFKSTNNASSYLLEVKDFQTRILFDRIGEDEYVVVSVFTKKTDTDKLYLNTLALRKNEYVNQKDKIKNLSQTEEYRKLQTEVFEEIKNKLNPKQKKKNRGQK